MGDDEKQSKPIPLILMAGQSNMDGMGWSDWLPESLNRQQADRWIYSPTRQKDGYSPDRFCRWYPLEPGFGYGVQHSRNGVHLSDRFGVELTFSERMRELRPDLSLALIKVAKGGSSLCPDPPSDWGTWDPGLTDRGVQNQFHYLEHAMRHARSLPIPETDKTVSSRPSLFIWIQGESDAAFGKEIATEYEWRLRAFLKRIRLLAADPVLPVLLVEVTTLGRLENGKPSMPWAEMINRAQEQVAGEEPNTHRISLPKPHKLQDPWHYDSTTLQALGERLAEVADTVFSTDD